VIVTVLGSHETGQEGGRWAHGSVRASEDRRGWLRLTHSRLAWSSDVRFDRVAATTRAAMVARVNKGVPMLRRLLVLSLLTLLLLAPASTAWARGDGWEPVNNQPFTVQACGTTVDVTFPMDKEYQKVTTDAEGNQHIKVTGALKVTLTDTATGRSVTYNISGPGTSIAYANGDFLFNATGRNLLLLTPDQAAATGLPQLFVTSGPISVLFRADGSVEVQRLGNHLQDICAALTG
jgi:hypothetical protein